MMRRSRARHWPRSWSPDGADLQHVTERALTDRWTTAEVRATLGARLIPEGDLNESLGPPVISTREVEPGVLFVALQGARSHGIEFAREAFAHGAAAVLVGSDAPAVLVERAATFGPVMSCDVDGVVALGRLARAWRRRCGFTVVGITGSTGKTSTKDILAGLLSGVRKTVASHANLNNEIGVPLTLLRAVMGTEVVICEMGMRGLAQIEYLCDIAEPDVGIITNAGSAHMELLGSVDNVVRAKAELLAGVREGGVGVVPEWQPELQRAARRLPTRLLSFGRVEDAEADCRVGQLQRTSTGIAGDLVVQRADGECERHAFALPVHGAHQACNLAAAVCAYDAIVGSLDGLDDAFARIELTAGRGNRHSMPGGGVLIDDAYNANPESMVAGLEELMALPTQRHVAVLGPMAELGDQSARFHRELGELCARVGLHTLVVIAPNSDGHELAAAYAAAGGGGARIYDTPEEACSDHARWLGHGDAVLVKASNDVGLRMLVTSLLEIVAHQGAGA